MQPDLGFCSDTHLVSVEMKVGAKSTASQVLKYALLGVAAELRARRPLQHYLLLIGTGNFSDFWKEGFTSLSELQDALRVANFSAFLKEKPSHLRVRRMQLERIVRFQRVAYINYVELARLLMDSAPAQSDTSHGAEVYRNLVSGLIAEFKLRRLISE